MTRFFTSRRTLGATCLLLALGCGLSFAQADTGAAVTIDNFTFAPATLTVAKGTKVVFTNRDDIPHTVTSALTPPRFRSPPLDTGETVTIAFDTPGTYAYFCSLHPHMQGTIVVK